MGENELTLEKELVCKAHELDHKVFGPCHVGDTACLSELQGS